MTDPRLVLLTSKNPKAIAQMGEKGVPCAYVAVEADREYYKGNRPSRNRSQYVYDKSGKGGSPGVTVSDTTTSARYNNKGNLGESYEVTLVPLKSSLPLLTSAKCHTVHSRDSVPSQCQPQVRGQVCQGRCRVIVDSEKVLHQSVGQIFQSLRN